MSLDLKRKANRSTKLAPDPHEMFWKPDINQGPIVEGTLEKKKLHFIGLRIYRLQR